MIADGFYEWAGDGGAPTWFHAANDALMLLGGLLKFSEVAGTPPRFSVLTTRSNTVVAPVHDRMPVIIGSVQLDDWLTGDAVAALAMMNPAPSGLLKATKVSKRVNSVKNDDFDCIAERGPDDQGSLF